MQNFTLIFLVNVHLRPSSYCCAPKKALKRWLCKIYVEPYRVHLIYLPVMSLNRQCMRMRMLALLRTAVDQASVGTKEWYVMYDLVIDHDGIHGERGA